VKGNTSHWVWEGLLSRYELETERLQGDNDET